MFGSCLEVRRMMTKADHELENACREAARSASSRPAYGAQELAQIANHSLVFIITGQSTQGAIGRVEAGDGAALTMSHEGRSGQTLTSCACWYRKSAISYCTLIQQRLISER
jgi:hypothetical protein